MAVGMTSQLLEPAALQAEACCAAPTRLSGSTYDTLTWSEKEKTR